MFNMLKGPRKVFIGKKGKGRQGGEKNNPQGEKKLAVGGDVLLRRQRASGQAYLIKEKVVQ